MVGQKKRNTSANTGYAVRAFSKPSPIFASQTSHVPIRYMKFCKIFMSKLIAFKDNGKQCWSRLQLDNGDPIWIGIAQSGIVVKKSRSGIFGAQIFKEKEIITGGDTARHLYESTTRRVVRLNSVNDTRHFVHSSD